MAHGKTYTTTYWVCVDCTLTREQGEEPHDIADGCNPWELIESNQTVTAGMLREEHSCDSEEVECDCEYDDFSSTPCDACGIYLAGSRHAYTVWTPED